VVGADADLHLPVSSGGLVGVLDHRSQGPPPGFEEDQRCGHSRVERLDRRFHGNGQPDAGTVEETRGEAWALGAYGEDESAFEGNSVEALSPLRNEGGPARPGRGEMAVEVFRLGPHAHRKPQQAPGRGAQGARVVRVSAAGGEGKGRGAGGLGHPGEGSQVAWILKAIEIEIRMAGADGKRPYAGPGEAHHRQDSPRRVGVGQILKRLGADLQRRHRQRTGKLPPLGCLQEGGSCQHFVQKETRGQSLHDQVWALQERTLAFTSAEAPNILEPLVLTTGNYGHGWYGS
jgi:hypothetical protein